jgi:RHS repeat-associated protein
VDAAGNIRAHYEYSPFGEIVVQSGDLADTFKFRFSTKYYDAESQSYYYGYRHYAPKLGCWFNRDPIGERGDLKLYGFVKNDPVNKWDYLGLNDGQRTPTLWWNNFINIVARRARYKKPWYRYSGVPWNLSASPYEYINLAPPETLYRKSGCSTLQAIEYTIQPAGGVNAFNTIGDPNDPYRLWEGDQIKTDWSYRNVFRYVVEVIFSGHGINRSAELLWELKSNFEGKWSWNTTAAKTVVEPITSGNVLMTITVRLHLLTDDRDGMIGISKDKDVYTLTEDKYEIQK